MTTLPKSLAEQALYIMANHSEDEMIAFVRQNADSRPNGHQDNPKSLIVLADHTAIMLTPERYHFLWNTSDDEDDTVLRTDRARRYRNPELFMLPSDPGRPMTAGGAPTPSTLLHEVLKKVESEVRPPEEISEFPGWIAEEPPIAQQLAKELAPTLVEQLNTSAAGTVEFDEIYNAMDTFTRETAAEILAAAPEEERLALADQTRRALAQES